jgi:hypothetical protein
MKKPKVYPWVPPFTQWWLIFLWNISSL